MKRVIIMALVLSIAVCSAPFAQQMEPDSANAAPTTMASEQEPIMTGEQEPMEKSFAESIQYSLSIGVGSALPYNPDEFDSGWSPSVGMMVDIAAAYSIVEISANFDYSFFLADSREPNDANVLASFINLKIKPLDTAARPYILVGGGLFRYWIVDQDIYENVLGFGGGAGVEIEVGETRHVFLEAKNIIGQTRLPEFRKANTELIPVRLGITFVF